MSLADKEFIITNNDEYDISIGSEALCFAFQFTWGLGTVGVGAKFLIKNKWDVWKWYKIINTLNNAEFYLKPKYLISFNNFRYIRSRFRRLPNQIYYKLQRMEG